MKKVMLFVGVIILVMLSLISCNKEVKQEDASSNNVEQSEVSTDKNDEDKKEEEQSVENENANEEEKEEGIEEDNNISVDDKYFCVPGYALGEIPAIPIVDIPVIPSYSETQDEIFESLVEQFESMPGVLIKPAISDGNQGIDYSSDFFVSNGDSAVTSTEEGGSVVNQDGSGVLTTEDLMVTVDENGNGVYASDDIVATIAPDGSGTITDMERDITVVRNPDGTGTYQKGDTSVTIAGEYDAVFTSNEYSFTISNENSAVFSSEDIDIIISDGKAMITSKDYGVKVVDAKPIPKVPMIPKLPNLEKLQMANVIGIRVIVLDSILFDFDKSELREEGKKEIEKIVEVLNQLEISNVEVHGHTDSISTDEYNQTLSEKRAESVENLMEELNVTSDITTIGFGEKKPVAPNTYPDGSDNPAGRQANRRVEIFVPSN